MKKNERLYFYFILLLFSICLTSASISLNINQPNGTLDVIKDQIFNVQATISCSASDCNNISVGLKIPNLETKTFTFSDTTPNDCFGGTCLKAPGGWTPNNISGNANWGCGKCFSNPMWVGPIITNVSKTKNPNGCVENMQVVAGANLCFETNNGERWNIVFSNWPAGGDGDFVYTRSIERKLLSTSQNSLPFYITSGENPSILSLASRESKTINISVKANGNVGSYSDLVFFASDQDSNPLNINIKLDTPIITTQDTETSRHSSTKSNQPSVYMSEDYTSNENKNPTQRQETEPLKLASNVAQTENSIEPKKIFWWIIFGIIFFVLLTIFISITFIKKSRRY